MKIKNFLKSIDHHAIVAYTDEKGVITYVNDNFCDISGYTREELIGNTHQMVNSGEHEKCFWANLWQTISRGDVWVGEICNRAKDGKIYWVNTTIAPEHNEKGEIVGYFALRYNITKRKLLEEENAHLMLMNNAVQEMAKVGGWEVDLRTGKVAWTDQTYKIHEVPLGFKLHQDLCVEFYIEEDQKRIKDYMENTLKTGQPFDDYFQLITAKSRKLWVRSVGEAVFDRNGKAIKLRGTFQDVTEQKEAEIKAEMERKVFLHSAKLSTLGEMASSMIHEISNPLMVVNGVISSAKRKQSLEEVHELLDKAKGPMERLTKMVKNLRKYSRNEAVDREVKINDLNEIIKLSEEYTRHKLRRNHVEFRLLKDEPIMINCEASELEQVFVNLFNNAADAVENLDDRWIEVDYQQDPLKGIVVTVTDSGSGIPKEIADNIFNSFYTTKERGKGTGIGLGVVSDIISEHQGSVRVDHDNKHTCFEIRFPPESLQKVV